MKKGYFISFEGGDGSGKSTQIKKLKNYFENKGYEVILTREPGGTEIGEKIRSVILDPENRKMSDVTETMLYAASRAQHVHEVIKPAIESGKIIICDRFVDSSIAYQGYGRGLGDDVSIINSYAVGKYMPNLTFLLKVRPDVGSSRIRNREKDRIEMEAMDFHHKVYDGYEMLEKQFPERIVGIDASNTIDAIHNIIVGYIERMLKKHEV